MTYCNEHGIPHSEFLSWDPDDRFKALAMEREKRERCALCGTASWEWEANTHAYEPTTQKCWGCYWKEWFQETEKNEARELGSRVTLVRNTEKYQAKKREWEMKRKMLESR